MVVVMVVVCQMQLFHAENLAAPSRESEQPQGFITQSLQ